MNNGTLCHSCMSNLVPLIQSLRINPKDNGEVRVNGWCGVCGRMIIAEYRILRIQSLPIKREEKG